MSQDGEQAWTKLHQGTVMVLVKLIDNQINLDKQIYLIIHLNAHHSFHLSILLSIHLIVHFHLGYLIYSVEVKLHY